MDKKKIIWISVSALAVLVIISIIAAVVIKNRNSNNTPATSSQAGSSQSSSSGKTLVTPPSSNSSSPVSGQNSSTPPTSTSPSANSQFAYPKLTSADHYITIQDGNNKEEVNNALNTFLTTPISSKGLDWTAFPDKTGHMLVPFDEFASSLGLTIQPQLKSLLDFNNYNLFSCASSNRTKSVGLLMNVKLLPDYKGNLYKDEMSFMKNWESTMFQDTRTILFPDANFTPQELQQKTVFKNGKYRYASISLTDNTQGSINYSLVDDFVVISNSVACLDKASADLMGQ